MEGSCPVHRIHARARERDRKELLQRHTCVHTSTTYMTANPTNAYPHTNIYSHTYTRKTLNR
jgi:hypothetical protein